MAWLPGERGGAAIAGVLIGARSPGGKLPVSYPRSVGQVPIFYGHKVSGGRSHWKGSYVDLSNEPLYPFGHGLSYSTFSIEAEALDDAAGAPGDTVDIVATVTNTGDHVADEVVQVYSRQAIASITRPVLELQGFQRVTLRPGASARVTFRVPVDGLGFNGRDLAYVIEPGAIEFFVGTSSAEHRSVGSVRIDVEGPTRRSRVTSNETIVEHLRVGG
jgi:beta-glucosidase